VAGNNAQVVSFN